MGAVLLAAREVGRRPGRFSVLVAAIAVLVFFLFFQQGLLSGLITQFVGALRNQDAAVLVYSEQARDNLLASVLPDEAVDGVGAIDGVDAAGPVGIGTFTVDAAGQTADAQIWGYQLSGPGGPQRVTQGRLPEGPDEAVVDAGADDGFGLGDEVTLGDDALTITVVGLGDDLTLSGLPVLFVDFATYTQARRIQNPDAQTVTPSAVAVALASGADADAVVARVNEQIDGVAALTRDEAVAGAPGVAEVRQSFLLILVLGYVVVAVVIGFFFVILTAQKTDQLTLLRAMGVSATQISVVVLAQVAVVVVLALVGGGGLALAALSSEAAGIPASLSAGQLGTAAGIVVALSLVAAGVSVRRIRRIEPGRAVDLGASL